MNTNTVGKRIRSLRKELHLNQTEFGAKIGLKQTAIGMYENEQRNVPERSIGDICREYSVNESWLRNGDGNMFIDLSVFSLDEYARAKQLTKLEIALVRSYMELEPENRKALLEMFRKAFIESETATCEPPDLLVPPDTVEEFKKMYPPEDEKII